MDQGTRDRGPLLFAAAELMHEMSSRGPSFRPLRATHARAFRALAVSHALQEQWKADVFEHVHRRQEIEELKNQARADAAGNRLTPESLAVCNASPSTKISPLVGVSSPAKKCISVLFPQPLGPLIATNSFGAISKETPSSACTERAPLI